MVLLAGWTLPLSRQAICAPVSTPHLAKARADEGFSVLKLCCASHDHHVDMHGLPPFCCWGDASTFFASTLFAAGRSGFV